jgi:hypothetical protein
MLNVRAKQTVRSASALPEKSLRRGTSTLAERAGGSGSPDESRARGLVRQLLESRRAALQGFMARLRNWSCHGVSLGQVP